MFYEELCQSFKEFMYGNHIGQCDVYFIIYYLTSLAIVALTVAFCFSLLYSIGLNL